VARRGSCQPLLQALLLLEAPAGLAGSRRLALTPALQTVKMQVVQAVPAVVIPNCPPPKQGAWSTECFDVCAPPGGVGNFFIGAVCGGSQRICLTRLSLAAAFCTCCAFGTMTQNAPVGTIPCAGNCCGGCCFASSCPAFAFCLAKNGLRTAYGIPSGAGELIGDFFCGLLFQNVPSACFFYKLLSHIFLHAAPASRRT